jgi:hypothetical protein
LCAAEAEPSSFVGHLDVVAVVIAVFAHDASRPECRREVRVLDAEKSRFLTPNVDERHFSTLNADEKSKFATPYADKFSTPDVDKKQLGDVFSTHNVDKRQRDNVATRELEEHRKYFSALYARVFAALAADEKLAAEEDLAEKEREKLQSLAARSDADKNPSSRRLTPTRSPSSCPLTSTRRSVDERHFSTLSLAVRSNAIALWPLNAERPSSRRLTSTRSKEATSPLERWRTGGRILLKRSEKSSKVWPSGQMQSLFGPLKCNKVTLRHYGRQ